MIYLSVTAVCIVAILGAVLLLVLRLARDERRELEDRLMAVSQPIALVQHKAHTDNSPAEISYVGEDADKDD